ncbi:hypothetical protein [Escherichia phage vB-EcoP-XT73]|nr:hypothetical protein [Escherichia phage vB-EcoP-XT73]
MAKEHSFTIPTYNYGEIDFSYTDNSDKCLILFVVGDNINAIDFPAVALIMDGVKAGHYLAQRGILLSLEEIELLRVALFKGKGN